MSRETAGRCPTRLWPPAFPGPFPRSRGWCSGRTGSSGLELVRQTPDPAGRGPVRAARARCAPREADGSRNDRRPRGCERGRPSGARSPRTGPSPRSRLAAITSSHAGRRVSRPIAAGTGRVPTDTCRTTCSPHGCWRWAASSRVGNRAAWAPSQPPGPAARRRPPNGGACRQTAVAGPGSPAVARSFGPRIATVVRGRSGNRDGRQKVRRADRRQAIASVEAAAGRASGKS